MKKIILFLMLLFCFPIIVFADTEKLVPKDIEDSFKEENIKYDLSNYSISEEKVNIYLFRGAGCSHCRDFLQFVSNTLVSEYGEYFNLISYEVWGNKANDELKTKVMTYFNVTRSGVPFIVIGNQFFIGFGESRGQDIINALMNEYNSSSRTDIVENIIEGKNIEDNKEPTDDENNTSIINDKKTDTVTVTQGQKFTDKYDIKELLLIGFVILVCVSILVVLFIVFGPKKKSNSN